MPALSPIALELLVFATIVLVLSLAWFGPISIIAYRRRRNHINRACAHAAQPSQVQTSIPFASACDLEEGIDATDKPAAGSGPNLTLFSAPMAAFLRWRHRVLYNSDSLPELAVLPWYRREESTPRKVLNFVLRKERVKPEPPTVASVRRAVEAQEIGSYSQAHTTSPTLSAIVQLPEIVLHCGCNRERFAIVDPDNCPSCSCPRSLSTFPSSSLLCSSSSSAQHFTGAQDVTVNGSSHRPDAKGESQQASLDVPVLPSVRSADNALPYILSAPSGPEAHEYERRGGTDSYMYTNPTHALSNDHGFSGLQQNKTFVFVVPASVTVKTSIASSSSTVPDGSMATSQPPAGTLPVATSADLPLPVLRLSPAFSTTSGLVDLLLEAIAVDTDASDAASSSSSLSSSLVSRRGSSSTDSSIMDEEKGEDDPVSEVLSLYFSVLEDDRRQTACSGSSEDGIFTSGSSWSSLSSLSASTVLESEVQVRTGWRASLARIWAAHEVSITVLSV
ncbi:hypothetical protein L227DRAFT_608685 [Lentinus tigrinus ALCF2SS1-6]|uniref:Uncharacterized protein n=1 Tax=Lentinus tigrinus ALCF2SS1-6 TaxID=1328759 RepID=A0A5C2SJL8_9APHY|nr:hypothetical protein L227DRAFT_608685 [Lentinus tigrinus ALCF2SS1-6]